MTDSGNTERIMKLPKKVNDVRIPKPGQVTCGLCGWLRSDCECSTGPCGHVISFTGPCIECAPSLANVNDKPTDNVNHPSHYTMGGVEVIDAIEAWELGYNLGNAVKYIARAGKKDPAKRDEDLAKAFWYLKREIGND